MSKTLWFIGVVLFAGCTLAAQEKPSFEFEFTTPKQVYALGEPIPFEFKLTNAGVRPIYYMSGSVQDLISISFTCDNPRAKTPAVEFNMENLLEGSGLMALRTFASKESLRGMRMANGKLRLLAPGRYRIVYQLIFECQLSDDFIKDERYTYKKDGSFEIEVSETPVALEHLQPFLKRGKLSSQAVQEVMDYLSCVDNPIVIPLLLKYGRECPYVGASAATALRRFAGTRTGVKALEELGAEFGADDKFMLDQAQHLSEKGYANNIIGSVYAAFFASGVLPSEEFLKKQLKSRNDMRVYFTLDYLLRAQQPANKIPLEEIEKLLTHKNENLARDARKVFEKISKEKVKDQF